MGIDATTALVNPNLVDFWEQVLAPGVDGAVLYGGRSSSKTRDTANRLIKLVDDVPVKMRILCIRRFQNKIQESVYTELKIAIEHLGLTDQFEIQKTTIIHRVTGSEFIFYGIERNLEEIKGTSEIDILWVEEAEKLTEEQASVIFPTIRKEDALILLLFNPKYVTDYIWKSYVINTPEHWIKRHINYNENPFLSDKALRDIAAMEKRDPELFNHIYLGQPLGDSELSIFKRRWLDACVDAHKVLNVPATGRRVIGFDPADDGEDACATADMEGCLVTALDEWQASKDELTKSSRKVWRRARDANATISYDTIGVGAFIGGHVNDLNRDNNAKVAHYAFHAGGPVSYPDRPSDPFNPRSPKNKEEYLNRKSQAWANTARKAMMTYTAVREGGSIRPEDVLSFSSDIPEKHLEELFTELCVPWWVETEGKKRVVPKKTLKKDMGVKSHNRADALIAADNAKTVSGAMMFLSKRNQ
ncbi:PBSX family phage terminase large subunit [Pseudovibrio exalbescens]|uniref:PBSX family phage terminase large subunit n=1 Tax=Pseudovibrio exalbescens TaxID=197461 RepID=UPI000C9B40C1|nr:PBSX family phage terminase large subunit [Pseudovibrio exalbescens]